MHDGAFCPGGAFERGAVLRRNNTNLEPVREMTLSLSAGGPGGRLASQHRGDPQQHLARPFAERVSLRICLFRLVHTSLFVINYK